MKKIALKQFGEFLISRPAGREAWQAAVAYTLPKGDEAIEVDFAGVQVLAPSWADEFLTPLREKFSDVYYLNADNASVKATLETIERPQPVH